MQLWENSTQKDENCMRGFQFSRTQSHEKSRRLENSEETFSSYTKIGDNFSANKKH